MERRRPQSYSAPHTDNVIVPLTWDRPFHQTWINVFLWKMKSQCPALVLLLVSDVLSHPLNTNYDLGADSHQSPDGETYQQDISDTQADINSGEYDPVTRSLGKSTGQPTDES